MFDNMVAVWSKEDSCGGNETLGLKKKANELLGTHEGKIPEGFHNEQMGTFHDIERQSTMQVLKKQVVIQVRVVTKSNENTNQSVIHITFITEYNLRGNYTNALIFIFHFTKISAQSGLSFRCSLPKMGFHSWLIAF